MLVKVAALVAAFFMSAAVARDAGQYEHVSPIIREWFRSLRNPNTGIHCCSEADCKRTEQRIEGGQYVALAPDGTWLEIPSDKIVHVSGNPTGEPVLCAIPDVNGSWRIFCFVAGALI